MSSMYSYALLKSDSSNVAAIWYIGPALAASWLVFFGFSEATELLVIGAAFIIVSNLSIIFIPAKKSGLSEKKD